MEVNSILVPFCAVCPLVASKITWLSIWYHVTKMPFLRLLIRRPLVRIQPGVPIQTGVTRILSWSPLSFWICTAFFRFLIVSRGFKVEQKWNKNISKMKLGAPSFLTSISAYGCCLSRIFFQSWDSDNFSRYLTTLPSCRCSMASSTIWKKTCISFLRTSSFVRSWIFFGDGNIRPGSIGQYGLCGPRTVQTSGSGEALWT